jgi:hypothetical protein
MPEHKKLSLRDLFHILGSKHYVGLLGSGVIKEHLQNLLDNQEIPLEYRHQLQKAIRDLERIENASREADKLLDKIKEMVYEKLNPDELKDNQE